MWLGQGAPGVRTNFFQGFALLERRRERTALIQVEKRAGRARWAELGGYLATLARPCDYEDERGEGVGRASVALSLIHI